MLLERDPFLDALLTAKKQADSGRGRTVLVEGEAGIGKTTLLQEFAGRANSGAKVLWGWCEALSTPRPLGPLQDMARRLDPAIADLVDNAARPDRLFAALLNTLQAAESTTVMIFEDVHWADEATLDLVRFLGRRISILPAMIVLTTRNDELTADHPLTHVMGDLPPASVTRLKLKPLSLGAVEELAGRIGRSGEELHRITAGNPFFVTELLASADGDTIRVPGSIRDAVWSRLSRLSAGEREVLEMMSIVPGAVELRLIREMLGAEAEDLVDRCVARGLLRRDADGYLSFRHELARQATLERLSPSLQRTLHGRVEAALEAFSRPNPAADLSRRLHHAAGAEDSAKVLKLAPAAASQASKVGAHKQAAAALGLAIGFANRAPPDMAAQLYEDWAYELGLASNDYDDAIDAHHRSIAIWRKLGRNDHVSLNLRRLSRLHWRQGEGELAIRFSDMAVEEAEKLGPSSELAMTYSTRSQLNMLRYRFEDAIEWGNRAIDLADRLGEVETRVHALNNVGAALLFSGQMEGRELMEASLALALEHDFHDHAARAYTNFAEYAVVFKDFPLAERLLSEGISFATRHDLDTATQYLLGRQAQFRMEQSRLREAETIARGVTRIERLPVVMRLPALTVLGLVRTRLGEEDGPQLLEEALSEALPTREPQRILPACLALVESAWLAGDLDGARDQLAALARLDRSIFRPWDLGDLAVWWHRCRMEGDLTDIAELPLPRRLELFGRPGAAANQWERLGLPYEAALSLMQVRGTQAAAALARAVELLDGIEARAAAALARRQAQQAGFANSLPKTRRGPYAAARGHPLGLTRNEQQVLELIAQGKSNKEVARDLSRSPRTIEHQVSSVLAKFNASSRMEVVLRLRSEPWLLPAPNAEN